MAILLPHIKHSTCRDCTPSLPYVLRCLAATLGADKFFRFAAGVLLAVAVLRVAGTGCGNWDPGTFGKHQTKN